MAEHEGGKSPGGGGEGEVLAALTAPWVQTEGRQPLEDSSSTGRRQQEGEDREPEVRREGDEEAGQRNRLCLNSIEGKA